MTYICRTMWHYNVYSHFVDFKAKTIYLWLKYLIYIFRILKILTYLLIDTPV